MWRRVFALIIALIVVVPAGANAGTASEAAAIQRMLDGRARAFDQGDRQAFLASVLPEAQDFTTAQGQWFDRARMLAIVNLSLRLRLDRYGELTRKKDKDQYGDSVVVAVVQLRYELRDYSAAPWLDELIWTLVERDDDWFVASDTALDDLGLYSDRQLWDFGDVTQATSENFIVFAHPRDSELASEILDAAGATLAEVDRVWKRPWLKRVPIFVATDRSELERLLSATFDVTNFVAFAVHSVDVENGYEATGNRIIINRANFARHSAGSRKSVLSHEMLHFATRESTGPFVPVWVEEGLAQLAESSGPPNTRVFDRGVANGIFTGELPDDLEFLSGGGDSIVFAYQASVSAMSFMSESYGIDKLSEFYGALGAVTIEPGTAEFHIDATMRRVLGGVSLAEFETRWADSVN